MAAEQNPKADSSKDGTEAKLGDAVTIEFKGMINGVAFNGGTASDFSLGLGSGQFIPGFEEQLVGAKAGDEKIVKVTFPQDYPSGELAGKEASFTVKVKAIQKKETPEISNNPAQAKEYEGLLKSRQELEAKTQVISKQIEQIVTTQLIPAEKALARHNQIYTASLGIGGIAAGTLAAYLTKGMSLLPQIAVVGVSAVVGLITSRLPLKGVAKQVEEETKKVANIQAQAQALSFQIQNERELYENRAKSYIEKMTLDSANVSNEPAESFAQKVTKPPSISEMAAPENAPTPTSHAAAVQAAANSADAGKVR